MRPVETLARRVDRWIMAPEDARRLAAIRIGLCTAMALRLATTDYDDYVSRPAALFEPVSYMKLFGDTPSHHVAATLQLCGILAALLAAAGLAIRLTMPLTLACSLVLDGMVNSAGRVIVGDALLTLGLIVLLASGRAATATWTIHDLARRTQNPPNSLTAARGVGSADDCRSARFGWPVHTLMITVALAYFFAGFQKLRYSGLRWVTSDNLRWILYGASDRHARPNTAALFIAGRPELAHLLAAGTLLLEVAFPIVLFAGQLRWIVIPAVVLMHTLVRVTIGLDYSAQWITVVVAFVNWPAVLDWVLTRPAFVPGGR